MDPFHVLMLVDSTDAASANFTLDFLWKQQIVIKTKMVADVVNVFKFSVANVALEGLVGVDDVGVLVD
jgi:hypothetical protein